MAHVYVHTTGQHLHCHEEFKQRLSERIRLQKEWSWNACDIILAFCTITSRVGTDVEAALKEIPEGKPVVLVVCHYTLDPDYVVPDSGRFINRQNVLLVNILFNEIQGFLRCLYNDEALKKATDCLIALGAECHYPAAQHSPNSNRRIVAFILILLIALVIMLIFLSILYTL